MTTRKDIENALKNVKDPELGYNIVDLGLIYGVSVENNNIKIIYTLTSPACPAGAEIEKNMRDQIRLIPNIQKIVIELTFAPAWTPEKMSTELRTEFGILGIF
ncbi:MAG: metal-sulfur cluster assembly factor [Candidatus Gracilibacteria bacterium]|jgi:metal-sulfur cluster biosynthetic enzyme